MFVRAKKKDNEKFSIQIVETYRKADKVHQKIIRHVGQAVTEREVEELKKLAQSIIIEMKNKKKPVLPIFSPEDFFSGKKKEETAKGKVDLGNLREEQRMIDGIGDIFGNLYTDLGFDNILSEFKKDEQKNAILKSCVLARIANPTSKRRTASVLEEDYGIKIPLDKIYRMMDFLSEKEDLVKNKICETTLSYFKTKVEVLFFDVTTLYFESIKTDDLKDFGFSKDCKFKESQVVLALVTTTNGLPITYRLFPGNTYEGHTLIDMIDELEKEFEVSNVLLVADRAMFNNDNLDLMESKNINYVVSARLKNLTKKQKKIF
ncbi:IS1634 family transposase [bacterium]|nr:IS1634 family transposase [bacterium]